MIDIPHCKMCSGTREINSVDCYHNHQGYCYFGILEEDEAEKELKSIVCKAILYVIAREVMTIIKKFEIKK